MATFLDAVHQRGGATGAAPTSSNPFKDDDGNIHEPAAAGLAAAGIATGTGSETFSPAAAVTRGQMATFLARTLDDLIDLDAAATA